MALILESLFKQNNMKKIHKIIIACFGLILIISSCKKALDINTDPNNSTNASVDLVLPSALGYTAYHLGNTLSILGGFWGQFWTQGPTANQYNNLEQYNVTSSAYNRPWEGLYAGPLQDLKYIIQETEGTPNKNYAGIAKIMQAYVFQYLTDLYGDIPFTEALDAANPTPHFDPQEVVYTGLIKLVDEGLALIDVNSSSHPLNDDLVYQGDMDKWKRFGNTLKLKIYLRQAYVKPTVAETGIKAMYAANAQFLETGEDADIHFTTTTFNKHPLFSSFQSITPDNYVASNTALQYLLTNNDPRVDIFYQKATAAPNAGNHAALQQGRGPTLTGAQNSNSYSKIGPAVGGPNGGETAPVIFISAAESYFLQAEAVVRGWGTGDAKALYDNAVRSSFDYWNLSAAQAAAYLAQSAIAFPIAGTMEQKIKAIIFQKWISMSGTQNVEAWTEWRRTGYPDIFTISLSSIIGNKFPVRLLIGDSEISRNSNAPAQKSATDKVWWDVNTTGQN